MMSTPQWENSELKMSWSWRPRSEGEECEWLSGRESGAWGRLIGHDILASTFGSWCPHSEAGGDEDLNDHNIGEWWWWNSWFDQYRRSMIIPCSWCPQPIPSSSIFSVSQLWYITFFKCINWNLKKGYITIFFMILSVPLSASIFRNLLLLHIFRDLSPYRPFQELNMKTKCLPMCTEQLSLLQKKTWDHKLLEV